MNNVTHDILKTLAYFDHFNYPLTIEDLCLFACKNYDPSEIERAADELKSRKIIFKLKQFYSLQNNPGLADKRLKGNQRAIQELVIAEKAARLLSGFPFVVTVAVSGSLSKYYADENTDIDFFIITKTDRLWIARTLMHLFKKLTFITGKQHWFCMNYYVDEKGLEIPEKNIFTAMEIVTLLPMQGFGNFRTFNEANQWTKNYFPAHHPKFKEEWQVKKGFVCKCFEKIFNSTLGDAVDQWLMAVTDKRWKKKVQRGKVNAHDIPIGMMVGRHFSKPDPANLQARVIEQYEMRVKDLLRVEQTSVNIKCL